MKPGKGEKTETPRDEYWRMLCEQASREEDPEKLMMLVQEIITYPYPFKRVRKAKENSGRD